MISIPWRTGVNMREFAYYGTSARPHTQIELQDRQLARLQTFGVQLVRFYASRHDMSTAEAVQRVRSAVGKIANVGMQAIVCLDDSLSGSGFFVPGTVDFHDTAGGHLHSRYWLEKRYEQHYISHVRNIVTALKGHAGILMWELGNEYALHPRQPEPTRRESQAFLEFANQASGLIKEISPNHLVSTGLVNSRQVASLVDDNLAEFARRLYGIATLDAISIHYYRDDGEKIFAESDLAAARDLKKPYYIGEVGADVRQLADRTSFYRGEIQQWKDAGAFAVLPWSFDCSERDVDVGDLLGVAKIHGDFGTIMDVVKSHASGAAAFSLQGTVAATATSQAATEVSNKVSGGAGGDFIALDLAATGLAALPQIPAFRILRPFTWAHKISAKFDDPANYGGTLVQKREGILFLPVNASAALPVLAAQRGYVQRIGSYPPGYGTFVVMRHDWYGETYVTWYGHMDSVSVREGDFVNAGQQIGFAGKSGSAAQICLFFTLQHLGKGKKNYVVPDVIDPAPLFVDTLGARDEAWWNVDVAVQDGTLLEPGEAFTATWQVRNAGTTTWDEKYQAVFFSGLQMGSATSVTVPRAAPGELVLISVNMVAPMATGEHKSSWILKNSAGSLFRQELYTFICVQTKAEQSEFSLARFVRDVTVPDGMRVKPGEKFTKTWELLNDGKTKWDNRFTIRHARDQRMDGPDQVKFPDVNPGRRGEISVNLTAPKTPGIYRSTWQPYDANGRPFDHAMYAEIRVEAARKQNTDAIFMSPVEGPYRLGWLYNDFVPYGDRKHKGVDYVGTTGLPIRSSGAGVVYRSFVCPLCTPDRPNFALNNLSAKEIDEAFSKENPWVYGFGNMVVVRYAYDDVPKKGRDEMDKGGHRFAYVLYAHLSEILVQPNTMVTAGMAIGRMGNSGNSTGPHLHLEIQLSRSENETIPRKRIDRIDPLIMFSR
jgi:murein DD-endopeptidase MepM/ murein hydrolase activator NlpD